MRLFFTHASEHLKSSFLSRGFQTGRYEWSTFADGELGIRLLEEVHTGAATLVGSVLPNSRSLFELLVLHKVLRENGSPDMNLFIPYLGYARQDRRTKEGEASVGVLVASLIRRMAASKLMVVDIHSDRIRKALGSRLTEISAAGLFAEALFKTPPEVIVSPDAGSKPRAERLAQSFTPRPDTAWVEKGRPRPNVAVGRKLHGEVRGKQALIIDDMIDTGGTVIEAVKLVRAAGACGICVVATHGIFSAGARDRLYRLPVDRILVTNTLPQIRYPRIKTLNIVPAFLRLITPPP